MESISDNLKLAVSSLEILQASDGSDTCTSYRSLMNELDDFNEAYSDLKSDIHNIYANVNCNSLHEWYTGIAYDETCTQAPDSLSYSILFTLMLAILSTLLLSLRIAWKTDTQIFLEISGVGDLDDDATVTDDFDRERGGNTKRGNDSLYQFKFNSVRFSQRKEMNLSTPESLFDDPVDVKHDILNDGGITKEESEKKAEFWKNLLKNNDKQRKKEARDDLLQQIAKKPSTRKGNRTTWEPDDPVEHGEVEVEARLYSRGDNQAGGRLIAPADTHMAYWQDPLGNYQSYELFGQYDRHSLLAGKQVVTGLVRRTPPVPVQQPPQYQQGVVKVTARRQPSKAVRRQPSKAATPIAYEEDIDNFISREPLEGEEAYYDEFLDEALQLAEGQFVQQVVQHSPSEYDVYYVEEGQLYSQRVIMSDPTLPVTPAHDQSTQNLESLRGLGALTNQGQLLQGHSEWDKAAALAIASRENQFPASSMATSAFPRTITRDPSSGKFLVQQHSMASGQQFVSNPQLQQVLQQNSLPPASPKQSSSKKGNRASSRKKSRSSSRKKSSRSRSRSRKNQRIKSGASLESAYTEDDSDYSSENDSSAYSDSEDSTSSDDESSYEERRRRRRSSRSRSKNNRGERRSHSRSDRRRRRR